MKTYRTNGEIAELRGLIYDQIAAADSESLISLLAQMRIEIELLRKAANLPNMLDGTRAPSSI